MVDIVTFLGVVGSMYALVLVLVISRGFPYLTKRMLHGKRAKKVFFVDTRELHVVVLEKERTSFYYDDIKYAWTSDKEKYNVSFYDSTQSEPVQLDVNFDLEKCDYYIISQEFTNVCENTLVSQLRGAEDLKYLSKIMYVTAISVVLNIYLIMQIRGMNAFIHSVVQQAAAAAGIPLV